MCKLYRPDEKQAFSEKKILRLRFTLIGARRHPARLEPGWRFTAVDPSESMLETAKQLERTDVRLGHVEDLAVDESCDAASLIGVLHHLDGDDAKEEILRSIRARLKPGLR